MNNHTDGRADQTIKRMLKKRKLNKTKTVKAIVMQIARMKGSRRTPQVINDNTILQGTTKSLKFYPPTCLKPAPVVYLTVRNSVPL